ncbi:MAG: succinate dehydrogenase assembly factor 2 [Gammaproteobacteria bacterium]|nr:succinate dehydrogenase assembly factor 2 [Gammaproteobacteria bacterium]
MRELDLLLQGFLRQHRDWLDRERQACFETLLNYPDAVLLEWLMGRQVPSDKEVAQLVQNIRNTATA